MVQFIDNGLFIVSVTAFKWLTKSMLTNKFQLSLPIIFPARCTCSTSFCNTTCICALITVCLFSYKINVYSRCTVCVLKEHKRLFLKVLQSNHGVENLHTRFLSFQPLTKCLKKFMCKISCIWYLTDTSLYLCDVLPTCIMYVSPCVSIHIDCTLGKIV